MSEDTNAVPENTDTPQPVLDTDYAAKRESEQAKSAEVERLLVEALTGQSSTDEPAGDSLQAIEDNGQDDNVEVPDSLNASSEIENGDDGGPDSAEGDQESEEPEHDETPTEIDYDVLVPMPDGREPIKLGELKDMVTDYQRREDSIQVRENQTMIELEDARAIIAQLGGVPEGLRERALAEREKYLSGQRKLLKEWIPQMDTREGFEKVSELVIKTGAEYGLSENDIRNLPQAVQYKILYDLGTFKAERESAAKTVKQIKKKAPVKAGRKAPRSGKGDVDRLISRASRSNSEADKAAAANALLFGNR